MDTETINPAGTISGPESGESDNTVLTFYDTDDPSNTRDDPVVEREYELTDEEMNTFESVIEEREGIDISGYGVFEMLVLDRETLYGILDEVVE